MFFQWTVPAEKKRKIYNNIGLNANISSVKDTCYYQVRLMLLKKIFVKKIKKLSPYPREKGSFFLIPKHNLA